MKVYRYRPLNDFLFKELYYRELYFASASELNDPLDLVAQFNFHPTDFEQYKALMCFFSKHVIVGDNIVEYINVQKLFRDSLFLRKFWGDSRWSNSDLGVSQISKMLFDVLKMLDYESCSPSYFEQCIIKIIDDFVGNSSIVCFSETNSDFLMWSHYASAHFGVCLEFDVEDNNLPIKELNERSLEWVQYSLPIKRVTYVEAYSELKAFDYLPILANHGDVDLMGLSKSYWHQFSDFLASRFCEKLKGWELEREWRAVSCEFSSSHKELRLCHYDPANLTGVSFGVNTPTDVKDRIKGIVLSKYKNVTFYQASISGGKELSIDPEIVA